MSGLHGSVAWLAVLVVGLSAGCETDSRPPQAVAAEQIHSAETAAAQQQPSGRSAAATFEQLSAAEPSPSIPVTASMVVRPNEGRAGDTVELLVQVRIARAHYLHAGPHETFTPVAMNVKLPAGLDAVGDWQFPTPEASGHKHVYRNSIVLRRSLKILPSALAEQANIAGELRYQACNEELCWPPDTLDLSTSLAIKRR